MLGSAASGVIHYNRPLSILAFLVITAAHLSFFGGTLLAGRIPRNSLNNLHLRVVGCIRDDFDRVMLGLLCVLAAVGAGMTFHDMLFGRGQLLLVGFSSELGRARSANWQLFFSGAADVSPLRSLTITSCLAVATLLPYARKHRMRLLQVVSLISAAVVIVESFLSAGRFLFGVLVLCLLISAAIVNGGKSMSRLFTVPRLVVGGSVAFYFLIVFPTQRNPHLAVLLERSIRAAADAELAGWVRQLAEYPGMSWVKILAYSQHYFSAALDKLNYFVSETDAMSWYKLGLYNGTQISQVIGIGSEGITPWHQTRLDIADLMDRAGWSRNPWSTGIRDLGIDFGIVGGIGAIGIFGYISQKVYVKSHTNGSYISLVAATYVSVSCFIFAFVSPFQIRILGNGFLLLIIFALVRGFAGFVSRSNVTRIDSQIDAVEQRAEY